MSDKDSDDAEVDHGMNAFTSCITEINIDDDSEYSDNDEDEDLLLEKLKMLRKEDTEAKAIQKERIQDLNVVFHLEEPLDMREKGVKMGSSKHWQPYLHELQRHLWGKLLTLICLCLDQKPFQRNYCHIEVLEIGIVVFY